MDWSLSWPNQSLLSILRKAVLHYIFMAAVTLQKVSNNMILVDMEETRASHGCWCCLLSLRRDHACGAPANTSEDGIRTVKNCMAGGN
jgi:hypothetical protein